MNKKALNIGLIIAGLIIVCFAIYMSFTLVMDYWKASDIYKNTNKEYVTLSFDIADNQKELTDTENGWEKMVDVDLAGLQIINEDIVGWLYFENLDISYPLLHSVDDSTYLRRCYTGENIQAGSIFMEAKNSRDFSDAHTIIYGHNMKDLSMFGKLKYYAEDNDFIVGHEYFQIITEKKKYRYKIFSYKTVAVDSDVYTVYEKGGMDFLEFVRNVLVQGSYIETDDDIKVDDHLITLSTCSANDRFIVTAVRCDEAFLQEYKEK